MKTKYQLIDEYISFLSGTLVEKRCQTSPGLRFWVSYDHSVVHHLNNINSFAVHDDFKKNLMNAFAINDKECEKYLLIWTNGHLDIYPNSVCQAYYQTKKYKFSHK